MTAPYGDAVIRVLANGDLEVVRADDRIGIHQELLDDALGTPSLPELADGSILLAGDPKYRYQRIGRDDSWANVSIWERIRD